MIVDFDHAGRAVSLEGFDGDHVSMTIERSRAFYEHELLDYVGGLNTTGAIVDVGAYIGNHSVFFGMFTEADRVLAIEPNNIASLLLRRNIAANDLGGLVVPLEHAVGATTGTVGLRIGKPSNLGHTSVVQGDEVELLPLDEVVRDEKVSVLKIDVEGYELNVLQGAAQLLADQNPTILIEARSIRQRIKINRLLVGLGFQPGPSFRNGAPMFTYSKGT